jgi:putative membrane protein
MFSGAVSRDWPSAHPRVGGHADQRRACGNSAYLLFATVWKDDRMKLLLRVLVAAAALGVATALVPGIELRSGSTVSKVLTLIVVALIVGVVNAVLKPIVKTIGCLFYVLTLGLIGLVVNGLLLWLSSWVAGKLSLPFHITGFWPAFWGAIIVGIVGWVLNMVFDDRNQDAG